MWLTEYKKNKHKQAFKKCNASAGVSDLLSYLLQLDDNIILHKDGALSAHFEYQAPDLTTSTHAELDSHSDTWRHALGFLGDGWMIEINVLSQPYQALSPSQEFPELVSALIDDERRLQFNQGRHFISKQYLSITWKPEQLLPAKMRYFANNRTDGALEVLLETFKQKVEEVAGYLARSIYVSALVGDELTTLLSQCLGGSHDVLAKPNVGTFLDSYLASEPLTIRRDLRLGDQFIKTIAVNDLPTVGYPDILASLSKLPLSYRWSSRFIAMDSDTASSYLKTHERSWSSKAIGVLGVIRESMGLPAKLDEDASLQVDAVQEAQVKNSSGELGLGFYTSTLVLMHEDKALLDGQAGYLVNHIQRLNFKARVETINACESYLGSLPGHGHYNLRKLLVDTHFVGQALPISQGYQGEGICPCPLYGDKQPPLLVTRTAGCRPFQLNLHVGDVGHTAILGPTGSGKSTLIAMLMASHRKYAGSRVIVLDKDFSHKRMVGALGGHYVDFAGSKASLSPLANLDVAKPATLERAQQWLSDCCELQGVSMTPERQLLLREALIQLAAEEPAYKNINHLSLQEPILREAIQSLNAGLFKQVMNGTNSTLSNFDVMGFDMGALLQNDGAASVAMIQALFYELFDCFTDKRPTLLILEEAWGLLKHPIICDKLTDWFKTLRKFNVALIFISQDLSDIASSSTAPVIQNSCMTRIYLPNPYAAEPQTASLYQSFGLTTPQIELLQQAQPKQDYYYTSALGNSLFQLELGELAESFLCLSGKAEEAAFDDLLEAKPNDWVGAWLERKQLDGWNEHLIQNYL